MPLNLYLKRAGIVTGPLARNTSQSALEVIKNYICGKPQFKGGPVANFGTSLHEQLLEGKCTTIVPPEDAVKIAASLKKLRAHPVVKMLLVNSIREEKCYSELNGVPVAYILDIHRPEILTGADLKTTSCTSLLQCVEKCLLLGYFRQGVVYKSCARLKHFYFIFAQKESPFSIHIVDLAAYPDEVKYAERELEFLLYFYKYYGNILQPITTTNGVAVSQQVTAKTKTEIYTMAKTGKEVLAEIKLAVADYKEKFRTASEAGRQVEKSKKALIKLIDTFPPKEQELYQEKLDKFRQVPV